MPKLLFSLFCLVQIISAKQDVSFYEQENRQGLISKESDVDYCRELKFGGGQVSSVDIHGGCVMLYPVYGCNGNDFVRISSDSLESEKIGKNLSLVGFKNKLKSFRGCDDWNKLETLKLYAGQKRIKDSSFMCISWYFDEYDKENVGCKLDYGPIIYELKNLCGCQNLPIYTQRKATAVEINKDGCLQLHSKENCGGENVKLLQSLSPVLPNNRNLISLDLKKIDFDKKAVSISSCEIVLSKCSKLTSVIKEIKFPQGLEELIKSINKKPVDIIGNFVISNNSTQVLTQRLVKSRTISEEFTFETIEALTHMEKVNVELTVGSTVKGSIPLVAEFEVSTELKTGYGSESTRMNSNRESKTSRRDKTFSIDKEFPISPNSYVVVNSYINVIDNMPMEFILKIELTGVRIDGTPLTATELLNQLPKDMNYESNVDDNTILVEVHGKMMASIGIDTYFSADERKLGSSASLLSGQLPYLNILIASVLMIPF